ncbi:MAG: S1 RNA-binding domain-containing protein [Mariprofundales bacterium]|nr:S1 RNA-binding domain-containing protein [Mariprofundales bacterium]
MTTISAQELSNDAIPGDAVVMQQPAAPVEEPTQLEPEENALADAQPSVDADVDADEGSAEAPLDATMVAPIDEEEDFKTLFEASFKGSAPLDEGQLTNGVVVGIEGDCVIIDIGAKGEGEVAITEFARAGMSGPVLEQEVEVMVVAIGGRDGVKLSVLEAQKRHHWKVIEASLADGTPLDAHVVSEVKGGFRLTVGGVSAFMPRSEADVRRHLQPELLVGTDCKVVVLDASRKPENVVVSRRRPLEAVVAAERQLFLEQHHVGDKVSGVVRRLVDYGAFVDLGGVDALLHISDMAWRRLVHPSDVLTMGQTIHVEITALDVEKGKVAVSMKTLLEDPWLHAAGFYSEGMRVTGTVLRVLDFGVVVELEPGIDGLIHNSEMSWSKRDVKPASVLSAGDVVDLSVLEVDSEKRRIRLSLKEVLENPWQVWMGEHPVGSKVLGKVKNITDFGFFVGLTKEMDGLVHVGNLTWQGESEVALSEYKKGQDVECIVLGVDVGQQRISLGIKQLQDDPLTLFLAESKKGGQVKARVVEAAGWGYVLELENGIRARLSKRELPKDNESLEVGAEVEAKVVGVNHKKREVDLSVQQMLRDEERDAMRHYRKGLAAAPALSALALELQKKMLDKGIK